MNNFARKKAMALLQHSDRTEWELRDRLLRAGYSDEETEDAIEYVKSFHYIDDERYAMRFVEIYHTSRSVNRLRQDLYKRHVAEELVDAALEQIEWDDSEALKKELSKIMKRQECEDISELTYDERQKIMAKLYRKGFKPEDIRKLLD